LIDKILALHAKITSFLLLESVADGFSDSVASKVLVALMRIAEPRETSSKLPRVGETQASRLNPRPTTARLSLESLAKNAVFFPRGVKPPMSTAEEVG
jgi:hypothetical protein